MPHSPLCKRLKEARLSVKLSQKKLGIAAGVDEFSASARINHYEKGRHSPDYFMLQRMGKILNLPTAYFYSESDQLAEMIRLFNRLNKKEKDKLIKQLRQ